jgi:phosphoserine phosphatase RsbU/P
VGGDYYDFLWLDKHRLGITVADVCGKGIPAAMLMSVARSMLKSIAGNYSSPALVIKELNRLLTGDLRDGLFITMFYAVVDVSKRTLTYSSAGHNPAFLWNGESRKWKRLGLEPNCLPLGVDRGAVFERLLQEKKIALQSQDVVVLYTDGVTEAMNAEWQEFGENRLQAFFQKQKPAANTDALIRGLDEDINAFCGDVPQNDDIAVIVIKTD